MLIEAYKSLLYSDTLVPDIFITEYLPSMNCEYIKVYLYCIFLSKYNKQASAEELSKTLEIELCRVKDALIHLESLGIITRKENGIVIVDLKEKEINKVYRMKNASSPENAVLSSDRNKKRNNIIKAINNSFFQGVMQPSMYTDIDMWFDRYKFDEDVMYALFQHCYDHKGLSKNYMVKVADSWFNKGIKIYPDLEKYQIEYQNFKDIRFKVVKKLKLTRNLTEYEEEFMEIWVFDYKYEFDIIDLSLKKTTGKTNPNFNYIHAILTSWHGKGLRSIEEIVNYEKSRRQETLKSKAHETSVPQHGNFDQRKHDDSYYENFFNNTEDEK